MTYQLPLPIAESVLQTVFDCIHQSNSDSTLKIASLTNSYDYKFITSHQIVDFTCVTLSSDLKTVVNEKIGSLLEK